MPPAGIPSNEGHRIKKLRDTNILFTPVEERFDRITRLASRLLNMPIALISLVGEDFQFLKSAKGLNVSETPRDVSFCAYAVLDDAPLIIENATQDARVSDNALVTGDPAIRFYAGYPLHADDGTALGALCVIDQKPRIFPPEDLDILRDLAALVEDELKRNVMSDAQQELIWQKTDSERKEMIDPVTRVWSRDAIMEILEKECLKAKNGHTLCLGLIDVPALEHIKEQDGLGVADEILSDLAMRIRRDLRSSDACGRYGTHTFLIVLNNCLEQEAKSITEKIQNRVDTTEFSTTNGTRKIDVKIRYTAYDKNSHASAEDLFNAVVSKL